MIDFNTISKRGVAHKNIDLLFDREEDRQAVSSAMKELRSLNKMVMTSFVSIDGKRHLAGVAYVPELAWYGNHPARSGCFTAGQPFCRDFHCLRHHPAWRLVLFYLALGH